MLTLALKDLFLLGRNKTALFWVIVFPLAFGLTYGSIIAGVWGDRARMGIALVDEDQSPTSKALAAKLAHHESVRLVTSHAHARAGLLHQKGGDVTGLPASLIVLPIKQVVDELHQTNKTNN